MNYFADVWVCRAAVLSLVLGCSTLTLPTVAQANNFTVTPSGDSNVTLTPPTAKIIKANERATFFVVAKGGYSISSTVGGSCPSGYWSDNAYSYTTGPINSDCTVSFSATPNEYNMQTMDSTPSMQWQ